MRETQIREKIQEIVEQLFYLANIEYTNEDAMCGNLPPKEEAERIIEEFVKEIEKELKAKEKK